jgi:hypothetical protein
MRKLITLAILILTLNCFSQTQSEMNEDANDEYKKADIE